MPPTLHAVGFDEQPAIDTVVDCGLGELTVLGFGTQPAGAGATDSAVEAATEAGEPVDVAVLGVEVLGREEEVGAVLVGADVFEAEAEDVEIGVLVTGGVASGCSELEVPVATVEGRAADVVLPVETLKIAGFGLACGVEQDRKGAIR